MTILAVNNYLNLAWQNWISLRLWKKSEWINGIVKRPQMDWAARYSQGMEWPFHFNNARVMHVMHCGESEILKPNHHINDQNHWVTLNNELLTLPVDFVFVDPPGRVRLSVVLPGGMIVPWPTWWLCGIENRVGSWWEHIGGISMNFLCCFRGEWGCTNAIWTHSAGSCLARIQHWQLVQGI